MRAREDWASPTCTLCFRERCLGLSHDTDHLQHLSAVCQYSSSSSSSGRRRRRIPPSPALREEGNKSFYQYHHSGAHIEHGSSPAHWWELHVVCGKHTASIYSTRQDYARLPTYYDPRANWTGICWTDAGISCLCAGSPTTALPLVRRFPPQHRTTAPVRQAQAAKPQRPVG